MFVGRFSAFLRAVVPGLAGLSSMHYRTFLWANAAGGLCWGVLYVLLGYFVGQSVEKATGIVSDVILGLILLVIVVLVVRHFRKEKQEFEGPADSPRRRPRRRLRRRPVTAAADQAGPPSTERSPACRPRTTRANSPAASSPTASVSMNRTAAGSLRSTPKRP